MTFQSFERNALPSLLAQVRNHSALVFWHAPAFPISQMPVIPPNPRLAKVGIAAIEPIDDVERQKGLEIGRRLPYGSNGKAAPRKTRAAFGRERRNIINRKNLCAEGETNGTTVFCSNYPDGLYANRTKPL